MKLKRAEVHIDSLKERINAFVKGDSHRIETELDPDTGEVVVYFEPLRQPPMKEWSVIIGDAVHNLRSSLDQLVWVLTADYQLRIGAGPPPNPIPRKGPGSQWRDTGFPVWVDPYPQDHRGNLIPWATSKEPKCLWGIDPSLRADFQSLQPFNHRQSPSKEPLAILNELWNVDKHRHLPLTFYGIELRDILYTFPNPREPEFTFSITETRPPGPLKGRTEMGRATPIGSNEESTLLKMHVKPRISLDVAFEKGSPAQGGRVIETLESLHNTAAAILVQFESELV